MNYILTQTNPLRISYKSVGGLPTTLSRDTPPPTTPEGYAYVEDEDFPTDTPAEGKIWSRLLTTTSYGWVEVEQVETEEEWYEVPAWRIRAIAKVTPFGESVLMDAVDAAITAIADPVEKAVAQEVFYHGNTLRRDSTLLTSMATGLGLDDATLDSLFEQAFAIEV